MDVWLLSAARRQPERVALETPARSVTYAELAGLAGGVAAQLRSDGVQAGHRVALEIEDRFDFLVALHGCLLVGAPAVPVDLRLSRAEREARRAGARTIVRHVPSGGGVSAAATISDAATIPSLAPSAAPPSADAVATVMHTSGTTSAPKPVELSHGNWLAGALGSAVALGLDPHERWLCPMPLTHVGGLSIPIRSAIYATSVVLHDRFHTESVLRELMDPARGITLVSLVPTMLARLLDAGLSHPPTLRWALLGGGPIPAPLLERARAADVPVAPTYGMTEACSQIATFGWPLPGVEIALVDDEVLVRGPTVAAGALGGDGWLHTGDLGQLDERGRLEITGRRVETIVSGGENVAPAEVEAVLLRHPAVADAGVFARADPEWGEAVAAAVVLRDGTNLAPGELRSFCAARLAAFKVPKEVAFVDALPRSESGKLLRRRLGGTV